MRQLSAPDDDGLRLPVSDSDDMALLLSVCAHGAKFCALEHSEITTSSAAAGKRIQAAGHAWATAAEHILMTHYGHITVTSLMTAVLLYDYRYRLGDFAHALVMSGLTTRMAHALQLNREYGQPSGAEGEIDSSRAVLSQVEKEARRRLMWACYVIDTWTGSGMDQLTLLREDDLHIQLPCNERDFLFQRSVTTGRLGDPPGISSDFGMMASYIRLVSIWKKVARYVKHLDTAALPWLPGSEFAVLDEALRAWRDGLAPYLDFSPDSIYTRLESSQLGALALLHCTYYNAMLDLYRVGMPELFSLRHAFRFPPEQSAFRHHLQTHSFQHACRMASVLSQTAAHGARHLADSMTPMFAYNSSRVMLYYLVRLHDPSRPDTQATVADTIRHVQSNNRVLQLASAMMPLSEPLLTTARHWLQKLQSGLDRQGVLRQSDADETVIPGMADDPASASAAIRSRQRQPTSHPDNGGDGGDPDTDSADSSTDTPDNVLHPLSLFRLARKTLNDKAYTEPSSRASSYAGGGLPPLRDVVQASSLAHSSNNNSHRPPSPMPERERATTVTFNVTPLPPTVPVPMYSTVPTAPTLNWESAFDDLATGLHVLQDYPHWDFHGFEHINSNISSTNSGSNNGPAGPSPGPGQVPSGHAFDNSGLTTWPEYRKT
ncbi:hypothetical protein Sste5346_001376 [Sporothrix stenoceras]|uniref:Xylanolytic transcriptional activator regulatory domain-containing protein n=1 Tax=Sporothrix stenoceras TaxID=5173 RepID=A0ABR3ZQL1_9PEZI